MTPNLQIQVCSFIYDCSKEANGRTPQVAIGGAFRWVYKRQNSGSREIAREKVLKPHFIAPSPSLRVGRTQAMDGNNTGK
jgi:hypothetical protein